jgi:hypothetical protein
VKTWLIKTVSKLFFQADPMTSCQQSCIFLVNSKLNNFRGIRSLLLDYNIFWDLVTEFLAIEAYQLRKVNYVKISNKLHFRWIAHFQHNFLLWMFHIRPKVSQLYRTINKLYVCHKINDQFFFFLFIIKSAFTQNIGWRLKI